MDFIHRQLNVDAPGPSFVEFMVPYLILGVSVILVLVSLRDVLPQLALGNLVFMTLEKPNTAAGDAAPQSKKQEKRLQQRLKAAAAAMPSVVAGTMTAKLLGFLEFTDDFEHLLMCAVVLVINGAAAVVLKITWGTFPQQALGIAGTSIGLLLLFLYKMEWSHDVIKKQDKLYILVAGLIAAPVAFSLVALAPPQLLAFRPAEAAEELTGRALLMMQSRLKQLAAELPAPVKDAQVLAWPLGAVAGILSGLLLAPGLRYGRVLQQLVSPPMWARRVTDPGFGWKLLTQLGFIVHLALIPLWVPALTDVLLIPADTLVYLRGLVMLLAALLQGLAVPTLVQGWLYTAALNCHVIHANVQLQPAARAELMGRHTQLTLAQTGKVAVQLSAVPLLLLICSVMYLLMVFPPPVGSPRTSKWDRQPSVLFQCVLGFLGWWSSVAYLGWASLGVLLSKLKAPE